MPIITISKNRSLKNKVTCSDNNPIVLKKELFYTIIQRRKDYDA